MSVNNAASIVALTDIIYIYIYVIDSSPQVKNELPAFHSFLALERCHSLFAQLSNI